MKAAYINETGPASAIRFGDLPEPALSGHAVRVRVDAVAIDPVDTYIRRGLLDRAMPMPFILGRDMVGTVEAAGAGVRGFEAGDAVWSNCLGIDGLQGPFAEYVAVPEERLFHLPGGVEPHRAVAVVHSALTAVIGLFAKARLRAGDTLFINGGSGNVGTAVLPIARAVGARVGVTAGKEEKARRCRALGADAVVDYHREDVARAIRRFAPAGLDVYFEAAAALDPERIIPLMAPHGRLVVITGTDEPVALPVRPFYFRNCTLHGFTVTGTSVADLQSAARQINAWLARGILEPKIADTLPLSETARAHRMVEEGGLFGKLVLVPDG